MCPWGDIVKSVEDRTQHTVEKQRKKREYAHLESDTKGSNALLDPKKCNGRLSERVADVKRIFLGKVSPQITSLFYT